jgi:hypothetical protein
VTSEVADDLADIRALNARRGPRCQADIVISMLGDEDKDRLRRALDAPDIEAKAIYRWLTLAPPTGLGLSLSFYSFEHHTSGGCRCGR